MAGLGQPIRWVMAMTDAAEAAPRPLWSEERQRRRSGHVSLRLPRRDVRHPQGRAHSNTTERNGTERGGTGTERERSGNRTGAGLERDGNANGKVTRRDGNRTRTVWQNDVNETERERDGNGNGKELGGTGIGRKWLVRQKKL